MEIFSSTAHELQQSIKDGELSVTEVVQGYINRIEAIEDQIGSFLLFMPEEALAKAQALDEQIAQGKEIGLLTGIPVGLKDNISTQGIKTTSGSKMLADYIPPYSATVAEKLGEGDTIMLGKLNMDELALGSTGEKSAFFPAKNPWDLDRVPGGSSSGSAAAVAAGQLPLALGTDTGGSIRQPAALCGLVGLKPTYGLVSRYGVVPCANSLDHIGPIARNVRDCALLLQAIAGHDPRDGTSLDEPVPNYQEALVGDVKGLKIGVPQEYFGPGVDSAIKTSIQDALKKLEEQGAVVEEMSLAQTDHVLTAYYILMSTEVSSNMARLDGTRYGYRDLTGEDVETMFIRSRTAGLGPEVKFRSLLGHFVSGPGGRQAFYEKGLKLRQLIIQDFHRALAHYDLLVTPTSSQVAWERKAVADNKGENYLRDFSTVGANLAGLPALSLPCGLVDGLPAGLQLIGRPLAETTIFKVAYTLEQMLKFPQELAKLEVK